MWGDRLYFWGAGFRVQEERGGDGRGLCGAGEERGSSNPSGKCSYEQPTRCTVCGTMRSMCGADADCLAMNDHSISPLAQGVRFNADKHKAGKYFTTQIWHFEMKCHLCDNKIVRYPPNPQSYFFRFRLWDRILLYKRSNCVAPFV